MCGSAEKPKFDGSSDWCVDCSIETLETQTILSNPKQPREYI